MNKYLLILICITIALVGCEKDRLKNDLYSPLDENSGREIFTIDSVKIIPFSITNKFFYCYFKMDYSLIKNPLVLKRIAMFKDGTLLSTWDPKSKYCYELSNVLIGYTYTYNLALVDINGSTSKLSKPIVVTVH